MLSLPQHWIDRLITQPETGMGYQVVSVSLKDGCRYDRVVINSGYVTRIYKVTGIPFAADDIAEIIVTHDKWDFSKEG